MSINNSFVPEMWESVVAQQEGKAVPLAQVAVNALSDVPHGRAWLRDKTEGALPESTRFRRLACVEFRPPIQHTSAT